MNAYRIFEKEINELTLFYHSTIYSFNQTDEIIKSYDKIKDNSDFVVIQPPSFYKNKNSFKQDLRFFLREILFIRLISALEVYLIDNVKNIFLKTKNPFKNSKNQNDTEINNLSKAELLSFKNITELHNFIINKECRSLSNGGFSKIIKYYKSKFYIDIRSINPGKEKIEEYYDKRNLIVHSLGHTDITFQKKYNTSQKGISINEETFVKAIEDIKIYCHNINEFVNQFLEKEVLKCSLTKINREIEFSFYYWCKNEPDFIKQNFEYWVNDKLYSLKDILIKKTESPDRLVEIFISGEEEPVVEYYNLIKRIAKRNNLIKSLKITLNNYKEFQPKTLKNKELKPYIISEEIIESVRQNLPPQPWQIGIHKEIAEKLNLRNYKVSRAINILIERKIFKKQFNGKLIDDENTEKNNCLLQLLFSL
jgi:hypothetical protein